MAVFVRQGIPPAITPADPPTQMPAGAGTQGIGVSTPSAAAVAEATVGFASEVHIPQGVTLVIGTTSRTVAAGFPFIRTVCCEVAISVPGVVPMLHWIEAPLTTKLGNMESLLFLTEK